MVDRKYIKQIVDEFERLRMRPELESFFKHLNKIESLSFEDKEFLVDQFRWADVHLYEPEAWIHEIVGICRRIQRLDAVMPEFGMFFIRLFGILNELPEHFEKQSKHFGNLFDGHPDIDKGREIAKEISLKLTVLKDKFKPIEIEAIEFMRNKNAHVFVNRYRIQRNKHGLFQRIFNGTKDVPRVEQMNEIVRYLAPYKASQDAFAAALTIRILPELEEIKALLLGRKHLKTLIV